MQIRDSRMRHLLSLIALVTALSVGGCAATHTAIAKRDLDVQNKMTDTIFLDPVGPAQKTEIGRAHV